MLLFFLSMKYSSAFQSTEGWTKISCPFITYSLILPLNTFHLQTYFKIYLRAHKTQVILLFFPIGTMLTTPCK